MSTVTSHHSPFGYTGNPKTNAYVVIGAPLRGAEHLGVVTFYARVKGHVNHLATEHPCPKTGMAYHLVYHGDDGTGCRDCGFVVLPEPPHAFGFSRTYDESSGEISYVVEAYDVEKHGPHGDATHEAARDKARDQLALMRRNEGPGPWFAVWAQDGEDETVEVFTADAYEPMCAMAQAGPFEDVRNARKAMHRLLDAGKPYPLPSGWTTVEH